ncbi:MAG: tRNA (adenosine(37)-N6)-threonylcarbamoyltransferase complex dimerization subunit type 1 TsaB [Bacteroidaceae bacterium]|nr:tRNA (adenosine(37)-N6)-threonylcarbamoyltransferase complex dimerization subunit type 1 TsaB [Bacteroidaceae bacterium]
MSCILHIETSTKVCSVALSENGACLFEEADFEGPNHATRCGVFVENALSFANSHAIPVDAVAISEGPGSYTGLRIGYSMAKGVCYGYNIPLIALPTLEIMCVPVLLYRGELEDDALLVPTIDARRMEVYSAVYDRALKPVRGIQADVVDGDTYREYLDRGPVYFFGDGSNKLRTVIQHPNARFLDDINPLAKYMYPLAERRYVRAEYTDVAYSEPFYLKEFVAVKPKNVLMK